MLGREFDTFGLLQPTSPLRTGADIAAAYSLFWEKATFAVVSVCEAEHSPLRKGTCAPYSLAISAYFLESVETITSSKQPEFTAASMVYAINGLPHKSLIFLSSKPFDPLLAGIIARFFTMFIDHKISSSDPSSLGVRRYLSLMRNAEFVLGNSSSGIIEAPAFHVPTVNIGDRQKGRFTCGSIINCDPGMKEIIAPSFVTKWR